jgi:PAS domain S-box-containing protein
MSTLARGEWRGSKLPTAKKSELRLLERVEEAAQPAKVTPRLDKVVEEKAQHHQKVESVVFSPAIERPQVARDVDFWANYGWLITTSAAMIGCYLFNLSNAGAFLLLGVIHSTFVGGWRTGVASAALSTLFSAIFLSVPDQLFRYTSLDARSLVGIILACFGSVFLIQFLRKRETAAAESEAQNIRSADIQTESERLFHRMADVAPVLLWMADADGKRYFFNQRWQELLTFRDAPDQEWRRGLHPDDASYILNRYASAVKSGERFDFEYRMLSSNGEWCWIQDAGAPRITETGEYVGYVGCCVNRTERKRVEAALHQLSGRLLELQDDERRRISRELHDTTAQNLAVLSMNLCAVKNSSKDLNTKTQQTLVESLELTEQCSQEIRTLSYLLHPPLLDELGLATALRGYATGYTRRTGIGVELKMDDIGRLPLDLETTLFRILQEALTNVHRHSGSTQAEIRIVRDPKEVRMTISDTGRGVPAQALEVIEGGGNVGVGIAGMRERAHQLGGQIKLGSSDRGTTITAILPLKERN